MIFLRIINGVSKHLDERIVEWVMALQIVWYGLRISAPGDQWGTTGAWDGMLKYMPENSWGVLCILLGTARLLALIVNGTFENTFYARYSPAVRFVTSFLGCGFWFMAFLSVAGGVGSGLGIYNLPLILDAWCVRYTAKAAGQASRIALTNTKATGNGIS